MAQNSLLPEEKARIKIDRQLTNAGWDIVSRDKYVPRSASAVKEALMQGNTESDYLLYVDDKAIAVVEAKREENPLGGDVQIQAEDYACNPQDWYGVWLPNQIPLVYLANGNKIYFKNMLQTDSDYIELKEMHSPKKMLKLIGQVSEYGALPRLDKHGGVIDEGTRVVETSRRTGKETEYEAHHRIDYDSSALDRSVVNPDQIREVLTAYKKAIYEDLYPDRENKWEYIPKTLIFAKDDYHSTQIVEIAEEVFAGEFENGKVPEHFVQKITYTAEDSNGLIRDLRTEKDFRIAVTVTLVATGTDVKPLEVVLFMKDVRSDTLYTQMKGRGCRVINDDKLKEVTPNAVTKECYYIVDAIGVTESDKVIPQPVIGHGKDKKVLPLDKLLEHLAHNEVSDENLWLLRDYCSTINRRYENNVLFGKHLDYFNATFDFSPKTIAFRIQEAYDKELLPAYKSPSDNNTERMDLIIDLIGNIPARRKLLEMQRGYFVTTEEDPDKLVYAGFSKETALSFIDNFEKYLNDNKDSIEALRIIYNSEDVVITHSMLVELQDSLLSENRQYSSYQIWRNYKVIDEFGNVDELDMKANFNALTNLIQIVRFAYHKNQKLTALIKGYTQRFNLYCGQAQRTLSDDQIEIMRQIAEFVINDGTITAMELNEIDTDLWRRGITSFTAPVFNDEIQTMSRFLLRVA